MPKPLVCISSRAGNRDKTGPSASHDFMTHLTVGSQAATVIAVDHSQSVSLGDYSGLSADMAPSSVAADGGVFTPGGLLFVNHVDGMVGLNDGHIAASLEIIGKSRKTKTPPATEAGGVLEKIDDLNQIVNYLPASLVRESLSKPGLGDPVPPSRLYRISATHTDMPGDHWVG